MKIRKKAILVSALLASLVSSGVMADQAADIQEAKDNAAQALEKVKAIDGKIQPMQDDLTKYKGKTDTLENTLKDYDSVKTNAAKVVQHEAKMAELTGRVSTAEQKVADAEKNLNTQAEAFRQVGQGVDKNAKEAKQKAEEALNKANDVDGKVKNIEKDLTTYKDKTDKLEKDLQDYDTVKTNAENAVKNKADIIDLKQKANKVDALEQTVTQIDTTVKKHNEEITRIKDRNRDFQEGIAEQLRQAKTETDTRVNGIDEKVKTISGKADALDHKIDNTRTDLEKTIKTVDEKVTKLGDPEARIKEVEKTFGDKLASMEGHTNKGLAKVTALSGLHPLGYDAASKWNISVATGHYKSENAIAMGAFFQPNRHVLLSFAGTVSGGDDAYTVGASIRVGRSGHKEMSGAAEGMISATEFYDIVGKLQDEIARQRQEIEALKNR
ncbi:YadA-like family protein [uncultured Megasphaera sp.]|uniref:YadA-like family protein n=1 Tax=uncultured Megasphaera sp. TaxID=165188 RepID=UPI0025949F3B|nr:YadA-like family protein [uncultured Megasphaera sp.]